MKRFFLIAATGLLTLSALAQPQLRKDNIYEVLKAMTLEEKATLLVGGARAATVNGVTSGVAHQVPGAAGNTRPIERLGIPGTVLADGPAGLRIQPTRQGTNDTFYCTGFPVGTLLASSWDLDLVRKVTTAMGNEVHEYGVDVLLAPGMNIHRNPLNGRNFEYFSEDPVLSGWMAAAYVQGIQSNDVGVSVKHYALNNQETNRHANNSVAGERAIREIYLEPFRISVAKGRAMSFMTSYNLVNGVPTADDFDLCTNLARGEWGFDGLIMTDWNGGSSTPSKSMHAGNDLITPGGFEKSIEILTHMKKVEPEFEPNGQVKKYRIGIPFAEVYLMLWHDYVPSETGEHRIRVPLGEGFTAAEKDGLILVNGEKIYYEATPIFEAFRLRDRFPPMKSPVDTKIAYLEDGGHTIVYKVEDHHRQTICRGDVQRCAVNILRVMCRLRK